jgi:LPXTG-motif cell wall-anchored protein
MNGRQQPQNRTQRDIWLYRMIFAILGLTPITTMGGAIVLASTGESMPDAVVALGAAVIGGLAGFLVLTNLNR